MYVDWPNACSRLLKAEIARADITLAQLVVRLQALGVKEAEAALKQKLYRGTFSMALFLQCMRALGHDKVDLSNVFPEDVPKGRDLDKS